jgi:inosine-uridine nucleoside N-ribohydrolase
MLVHLDTDLGGDTDDACALALLLGQSTAELAGVTTVADRAGAGPGTPATAWTWRDATASRWPPGRGCR